MEFSRNLLFISLLCCTQVFSLRSLDQKEDAFGAGLHAAMHCAVCEELKEEGKKTAEKAKELLEKREKVSPEDKDKFAKLVEEARPFKDYLIGLQAEIKACKDRKNRAYMRGEKKISEFSQEDNELFHKEYRENLAKQKERKAFYKEVAIKGVGIGAVTYCGSYVIMRGIGYVLGK